MQQLGVLLRLGVIPGIDAPRIDATVSQRAMQRLANGFDVAFTAELADEAAAGFQ